ncbi:MAG: hypothetical protein PVJ75_07795 [Chloroflexota bacterium]
MTKLSKLSLLAVGAILALVLVLGATAVFAQSGGNGDDAVPEEGITVPEDETTVPETPSDRLEFHGHHGMPGDFGPPEGLTARDELLADALDVDVETLTAARGTARTAAVEQALEEDLITEEQAEMLLNGDFDLHHGRGFKGFAGTMDQKALLAEALDISVEELEAAEQQAHEAALAEMVDAGYLTEEEALVMTARGALKEAIDRKALMAEVLNLSETELDEAMANRESLATLIENSGMTVEEFQTAMQAALEAAVAQAAQDGVITAEQYEALQNAGLDSFGLDGRGFGGHGCGGHGRHGGGFGEFGGPAGNGHFLGTEQPSTTAPTGNSI